MSIKRDFTHRIIINSILVLCILAMICVSIFVYKANAILLLAFLVFFIVYLQLPGLLVLNLLKINPSHISIKLLLSALTGWIIVIGEYAVSEFISTNILLYTLGPVLTIIYVYGIYKGKYTRATKGFSFANLSTAFVFFVTITLLYVLLTTQYTYLAPSAGRGVYASIDKAFQMGLVDSLADGYPIANPWMAGKIVHYHVFTQILYAVPVRLFNFTADFLIISCGPYLLTYFLCLAFYSMFKHFCSRTEKAGLYSLCVLLSYMFVAEKPTSSYAFRIIFTNDNYGGFSIASAIGFIIALDIFMECNNRLAMENISKFILPLTLIILTAGIKAPVALILVGAVVGTYLLGLITNKCKLSDMLPIILLCIAFLVIYKMLLSSGGTSSSGGNSILKFGSLIKMCFWHKPLVELLSTWGLPSLAKILIIVIVYFGFFFSAFFIPMAIGYIRELILVLRGIKPYRFSLVAIYAATFLGTVFSLFLNYRGHSQIYFGIVATAFAPIIAFLFLEDVLSERSMSTPLVKAIGKSSLIVFAVVLVISTTLFGMNIKNCIPTALQSSSGEAKHSMYRSMTHGEYEAMKWIRDNTSEGVLIATQMYRTTSAEKYDVHDRWLNTHFLYAAYSERNFYIEGTGFSLSDNQWKIRQDYINNNNKLFNINNDNRGNDADAIGVDYVVVTKKLEEEKNYEPIGDLSNTSYKLVFSNDDIDIYEVV